MKKILLFLALLIIPAFLRDSSPVIAETPRQPLVLAFYYAWYDYNIWKPSEVVDYPKISYSSNRSEMIAWQILQAKSVGIDAFVVSWWGKNNPTEDNFKLMLDQAKQADFKLAIDFELTSPYYKSKQDAVNSLYYMMTTHANHPNYLRVDGKPVIFFWREQNYSVDEWRQIRNQLDPNKKYYWIAEGIDESYQAVFDGHHLYMVAWAKNVTAELNKWPRRIRKFGADKIWVATVNPGADNRKARQAEILVRDRENGNFYREMWNAAFTTSPDWIIINSWNEWVEGTMIEPSVTYGDLYLNITREFAAKFHAGLPAATPLPTATPRPTSTPTPTRTPAATSTPTSDSDSAVTNITTTLTDSSGISTFVNGVLRVRAEPNTTSTILGRLTDGAKVTFIARSDDSKWGQIAFPDATSRGWIAIEFTRPVTGVDSLPLAQNNATMQTAPAPTPTPTPVPTETATPTEEPSPASSGFTPYIHSSAPFNSIPPP